MHMLHRALVFVALIALASPVAAASDSARWEKQAAGISIVRDDWGIAHVHAKTDINAMGRLGEIEGEVTYPHPQFIPRRDDRFDYTRPVDGADPATDWKGLHGLDEAPRLLNPGNGWITNTNNWPCSAAGAYSPRRAATPRAICGRSISTRSN